MDNNTAMIYLFKDVDKSTGLALYGSSQSKSPYSLVRQRGEDFFTEMLLEKKSNIKITGFANIVNFLAGNSSFSEKADFVSWMCNQAKLDCAKTRALIEKELPQQHPLVSFVYSSLLRKHKASLQGEELNRLNQFEETHKQAIEKYIKDNENTETKGPAPKQPANAPAAAPKQPAAEDKPDHDKKPKDKKKDEVPEEYKKLVFGQRLTRSTKGQVILPKEGENNILVTSALPYVNNVPHLGNLIGSLLSADVFARYSRLKGNNTIYICGTDQYGTASEIKGITEGKPPKEIVDYYHKIHTQIYDDFDIDFDYFTGTATPKHSDIVQDIFKKDLANGYFVKKTSEEFFSKKYNIGLADRFITGTCPYCSYEEAKGDQCDKCGKLLEPEKLVNPKCTLSGEAPEKRKTDHYYLDLTNLEDEVKNFIETRSKEGKWSANSTAISEAWIKTGLQPRSMTRDLNWGVKVPVEGLDHKVFYVWFDAPIGYISITANYTDQWEKWWKNPKQVKLFQFMGKDNVPFHTVLFPASLLATKEDWTMLYHISTTEYLNYESGKFSKSQNRGIFGDHVRELPFITSCWRYYLLINRPEASDSLFKWDDFQSKVNQELLQNPGNLCNRVLKYIYEKLEKKVPARVKAEDLLPSDVEFLEKIWQKVHAFVGLMDWAKLKDGLKTVMEISSDCNKFISDNEFGGKTEANRSKVILTILANMIRLLGALFEPFMPGFSAIVYFFLGITRTPQDEKFIQHVLSLKSAKDLLTLVPEGLTMNQPIPIFSRIEEIDSYRKRFN